MNKQSSGRHGRRSHSAAFKAKVALAALRENKGHSRVVQGV